MSVQVSFSPIGSSRVHTATVFGFESDKRCDEHGAKTIKRYHFPHSSAFLVYLQSDQILPIGLPHVVVRSIANGSACVRIVPTVRTHPLHGCIMSTGYGIAACRWHLRNHRRLPSPIRSPSCNPARNPRVQPREQDESSGRCHHRTTVIGKRDHRRAHSIRSCCRCC